MSSNQVRQRRSSELARDTKTIASLYLQGLQQAEIGQLVGLDQSQVSRHISKVKQQWIEDAKQDVIERTAQLSARYEMIFKDSYAAWEKRQMPGHLRNALTALASISRLFGLDKLDVNITAKLGISSVSFHQMISKEETAEAMAELETWHQSIAAKPRVPASSVSGDNDSGSGENTRHLIANPGGSETIEPLPAESEPEPAYDNYLAETDPNSPDFPLTI